MQNGKLIAKFYVAFSIEEIFFTILYHAKIAAIFYEIIANGHVVDARKMTSHPLQDKQIDGRLGIMKIDTQDNSDTIIFNSTGCGPAFVANV